MTRTRKVFAICLILGFLKGHPDECRIVSVRRYNALRILHISRGYPGFFFHQASKFDHIVTFKVIFIWMYI